MAYIIPDPSDKRITQLNINDLLGDLYVTKNIDLSDRGYIKLAHRSVAVMTEDDSSDFDNCDAIGLSDDGLWVVGDELFLGTSVGLETLSSRAADTNSPSPGVEEDFIFFNDREVASDGANVKHRSASTTWTSISLSLSTSAPTSLAVFDAFNALLVGNGNSVRMINSSFSATPVRTLTLPATYQVTSIDTNNNYAAIATRSTVNGEAKLFIWDGSTTAHNGSYGVGTHEIFSVRKYKSSFVLVTSLGQVLYFNGGGYDELAAFPPYYWKVNWADALNDHSILSNRGMWVDGDDIYFRLNSEIEGNNRIQFSQYFPGGVWKFSPLNGLHVYATPSFTIFTSDTIPTSDVNTTTDVITVTAAPVTGTPVQYEDAGGTVLEGLKDNKIYYVIKLTATTIKLASTYSNAIAGTAIDLTGTGNSSQSLKIFWINDFGWSYADNRGAVAIVPNTIATNQFTTDRLVFTANVFGKQSATPKTALNILHPLLPNIGYFITPKMTATEAEDFINKLLLKYKPLKTDDKIKIKYRTSERLNMPQGSFDNGTILGGTWSDTNTFTTTADLSSVAVGDEVEFVAGVGAGWMSHVSSISYAGGTYTVNLEDEFIWASANDIMYFFVDNWTKFHEITASTQNNNDYDEKSLDKSSKWHQFKVVLEGIDVTIEEFQADNQQNKALSAEEL